MPSIHQLPDSIINKIAAGEVVERPASVVKELVENALDASATQIDVEISEGGKKTILVRDDGEGIPPEELLLALSRHSTSKIHSLEDIFSIKTLGFRGEALASIASVSKMTLTSKWRDGSPEVTGRRLSGGDHPAREIRIEGGKVISEKDTGHPEGTSVAIKYLFYQTPARLKFLKSPETETTHIVDGVTRQALANPHVGFRLHHNGKKLIFTQPGATIKDNLRNLFGKDIADSCYEIENPTRPTSLVQENVDVTGAVGHPLIARSHNRNLYLFVNGRAVKDKVLTHAVMEAYRNLLMRGRYPFVVLFINVPKDMVDVNVHPAKAEVRFSNSSVVHRAVLDAVRGTLEGEPWKGKTEDVGRRTWDVDGESSIKNRVSSIEHQVSTIHDSPKNDNQLYVQSARSWDEKRLKNVEFTRIPYSQMSVIGQLLGTYLLCEGEGKLVLIDQHAAHERVRFEKLLLQYREGAIPSQQRLIPENFDLKHSDAEILKKYLKELEKFGLEIEFFGGCTFVVKAIPVLFHQKVPIMELVLDLIGDVLEKGRLTSFTDNLQNILASMACHSAIRAHHHLSHDEIRGLLNELEKNQSSSFCPHGRPVSVEVTEGELERWFKRTV